MKYKTQKNIISMMLMLVLVVGCFAALPITANAAPKPVAGNPSDMDWNPAYAAKALTLDPYYYDRGNAAGDKIPSNAHSADYPGLYFYWNDQQKDDGVLLVAPFVFELFVDGEFTVTAKTSSYYWGHIITPDQEAYDEDSGLYIFNILRNCMYVDKKGNIVKDDMKNINMIFIDGSYKDGQFNIKKTWFDEDGNVIDCRSELDEALKFNNDYTLGPNTVEITDYKTAVNGKSVTVTEMAMPAGFASQTGTKDSVTVKATWNGQETAEFFNQKQWAKIEIVKIWLDIDGEEIVDTAGLEASFTIDGESASVGVIYDVKAGSYIVSETGCTAGFELVSPNNVEVTVAAGEEATVTFFNQDPGSQTEFIIRKHVDGQIIAKWVADNGYDEAKILEGLRFELYKVAEKGALPIETKIIDVQVRAIDGVIDFSEHVTEAGWYMIKENFDAYCSEIFESPEPLYVYFDGKVITGKVWNFNYDCSYEIINGYGRLDSRVLGYGQSNEYLNNDGDLFYIGVKDIDGNAYDSYCANAGSKNFAGDNHLGCTGYVVDMDADYYNGVPYSQWLAALNYIEDNCIGGLKENRAITQTVIWVLLGQVDVDDPLFEATNLSDYEKDMVREAVAAKNSYAGEGNIVDLVYMVCEDPTHTYEYCQPQLVPIKATEDTYVTFENKAISEGALKIDASATLKTTTKTILEKSQRTVTPHQTITTTLSKSYSSVTATNDSNYPNVVPNSNHFTYAKLAVADLYDGISLDMVEGNKIGNVGTVFVQIVNDKLVVSINNVDVDSGLSDFEFGAIAYTILPEPKNGNIHTLNEFKHNNKDVIDLPAEDENGYIYLYIHCAKVTFVLSSEVTAEWEEEGEYTVVFSKVIRKDVVVTEVDVTVTVYDSEGNVVDESDFGALKPGSYTIVYTDAKGGSDTAIVEVIAGETATSSYSATYKEKADSIIKEKVLPDIVEDTIIHKVYV